MDPKFGLLIAVIVIAGTSIGYYAYDTLNEEEEKVIQFEDYGQAPDFTLKNFNNDSVTFSQSTNKVRALTFIYTRCTFGCSTITLKMMNVLFELNQESKADDFQFFIVNFDYMHDNATVLESYANLFIGESSMPNNIEFLLGNQAQINQTTNDWLFSFNLEQSPMMMDMNDTMDGADDMNDTIHAGHEVIWSHPFVVYIIDKDDTIVKKIWGLTWEQQELKEIMEALV